MKFFDALLPNASRRSLRCHESLGDRIARVEPEVRLVGAHLVTMMGEVDASVDEHRLERRIRQQPAPDVVVQLAVGEQQAVRSLVGEDVETHVTTCHQHEGEQVRPPGVDPCRGDHDAERLQQRTRHGEAVAHVRDATQFVTPDGRRHATAVEPVGRQHVGQVVRRRHERRSPARVDLFTSGACPRSSSTMMLHFSIMASKSRNESMAVASSGIAADHPLDRAVAVARFTSTGDARGIARRVLCALRHPGRHGANDAVADGRTWRVGHRRRHLPAEWAAVGSPVRAGHRTCPFDARLGRVVVRRHRRCRPTLGGRSSPLQVSCRSARSSENFAPISGCARRISTCRPISPARSCRAVRCSTPMMPRWPVRCGTSTTSTNAADHSPRRSMSQRARSPDAGPAGLPRTFVTLARALRHLRVEPQLPERLHSPAAGDGLRTTYRDVRASPSATNSPDRVSSARPVCTVLGQYRRAVSWRR